MTAAVPYSRNLDLLAAPLQGMRRSRRLLEDSAEDIAKGNPSPENMVSLTEAEVTFKANATVAKVADGMVGTILNTFA